MGKHSVPGMRPAQRLSHNGPLSSCSQQSLKRDDFVVFLRLANSNNTSLETN